MLPPVAFPSMVQVTPVRKPTTLFELLFSEIFFVVAGDLLESIFDWQHHSCVMAVAKCHAAIASSALPGSMPKVL